MTARVLVAGCGYLGSAAATLLAARGCEVAAVRRRPGPLPPGIEPAAVDLLHGDLAALPEHLDALVWCVAPADGSAAAYRSAYVLGPHRLLHFLRQRGDPLQRAVLVSSTRAWECVDGNEVDEQTPPLVRTAPARQLLEGEREFCANAPRPSVLRFAGIYGPGREWLCERVRQGAMVPSTEPRFTNRIHRDDGAAAIAHVLSLAAPQRLYVVSDDDPADERQVLQYLAARLGATLPAPAAAAAAAVPPGSKRCRNARLRQSGWTPRYPSFRDGYGALLAEAAS